MIDIPTFDETIQAWIKKELQKMLDEHMAYEVHKDLYGIWCGPPDPVKYPWTIDGELGVWLMGEWFARDNGPKGIL